jgi:TorA maturation chaperone TorD
VAAELGGAAARGVGFNRVGELLLRPDEALFRRLACGSLLTEVEQVRCALLDGTCTGEADAALEALKCETQRVTAAGLPTLEEEYDTTFGHAAAVDHPPYEMHYAGGNLFQQTHDLSDVNGFYRAFGVDVPAASHERPDHVGIEMEFLGLLCVKEANAIRDGLTAQTSTTQDAQRRFLAEHLGGFVTTLHRQLAERGRSSFYCAVLRLASALVDEDCVRLGIPPEERQRHHFVAQPPPGPENGGCFGCSLGEIGNEGGDS